MKKNLLHFGVLMVLMSMFFSCSKDDDSSSENNGNQGGSGTVTYEVSDFVGKWSSSAYSVDVYVDLEEDGTGTMVDPNEDSYDITWKIGSIELDSINTSTGTTVNFSETGIVITDADGYYYELQIIANETAITALKDYDNNITYKKTTSSGDDPTGDNDDDEETGVIEITGIELTESENISGSYIITWDAVENASSYHIFLNDESVAEYVTSIPFTTELAIEKYDTLKITAIDQLNNDKVIASGFIIFKESEPVKVENLSVSSIGDASVTLTWDAPSCTYTRVIVCSKYTTFYTYRLDSVNAGTNTITITGLTNYKETSLYVYTYNAATNEFCPTPAIISAIPEDGSSIYLPGTTWITNDAATTIEFNKDMTDAYLTTEGTKYTLRWSDDYPFKTTTNWGYLEAWDAPSYERNPAPYMVKYDSATGLLTYSDFEFTKLETSK